MATDFEEGVLIGLLVGEGHFGGDGRQPQVTLRMHERHEALFRWLERTFPGSRLYGPYEHGGRRYYQWMARGQFLREELFPILRRRLPPALDRYAHARFLAMCTRYASKLGRDDEPARDLPSSAPAGDLRPGTAPGSGPAGAESPSTATTIFAALRDAGTTPGAGDSG